MGRSPPTRLGNCRSGTLRVTDRLPDTCGIDGGDASPAGSRPVHARAVLVIVLLGLAVRYRGLGVPWPVAKYGGSILWGAMVYHIVAFAIPSRRLAGRMAVAALIALLVEVSRLYHTPWLDGFRLTTAGALLLGRFFSGWNILAYWSGILAGAAVDTVRIKK